ncbi:MAG: peptidoglycan DD-metalloendopeptidase family protein [Clostridiaceae bacterium]|nr:peptidoglycan DD-metalloendopeptidase family protein [Clostridiaceae bacterium]
MDGSNNTRSNAYMEEYHRADKRKRTSSSRICIAVPKAKMTNLNIKPHVIKNPSIKPQIIGIKRKIIGIKGKFIGIRGKIIGNKLWFYSLGKKAAMVAVMFLMVFTAVVAAVKTDRYQPAVEVFYNGKSLGIVTDEQVFKQCMQEAKKEISKLLGDKEVVFDRSPEFVETRATDEQFTDPEELKDRLKSMVDVSVGAYAILIDGVPAGILKDEETAKSVLEELKKPYISDNPNVKVGFAQDVKIEKMFVKVGEIQDKQEVFNNLSALKEEVKTYTIKEKDTLWDIAIAYKISVDEILRINPGLTENIHPGQVINLSVPQPVLSIETREKVVYNEEIPYEVKEIKDDSMYQGRRVVVEEGVKGEQKVEAEIIRINGIEEGKDILTTVVLSEPKAQTERVGTKPLPPKHGTGEFRRPIYGVLTSRYGWRGREMHNGIDIAANTGDPIYAADGGKVIFAGRQGSYGLLVKIHHDNEYVTYYGHCSKILVKVGDRVAKGEVIAKVGSTGRSTGPHLHFEVRKNGVPQNPLDYLK